jgi:hypothetical protein
VELCKVLGTRARALLLLLLLLLLCSGLLVVPSVGSCCWWRLPRGSKASSLRRCTPSHRHGRLREPERQRLLLLLLLLLLGRGREGLLLGRAEEGGRGEACCSGGRAAEQRLGGQARAASCALAEPCRRCGCGGASACGCSELQLGPLLMWAGGWVGNLAGLVCGAAGGVRAQRESVCVHFNVGRRLNGMGLSKSSLQLVLQFVLLASTNTVKGQTGQTGAVVPGRQRRYQD